MIWDIGGPKKLRRIGPDRYRGVRTVLVKDTLAESAMRSLYGREWEGFRGSGPTPRIRDIQSEWEPEGYAETARLTLIYDSFGDIAPGFARVFIRRGAKTVSSIRREPVANGGKAINGVKIEEALGDNSQKKQVVGFNYVRVIDGSANLIQVDHRVDIIVETAYFKAGFNYANYYKYHNKINKTRMTGVIEAPKESLLNIGIEVDWNADPLDEFVKLRYYFIFNPFGWNSVEVERGCWMVQSVPVFIGNAKGKVMPKTDNWAKMLVRIPGWEIENKKGVINANRVDSQDDREPYETIFYEWNRNLTRWNFA